MAQHWGKRQGRTFTTRILLKLFGDHGTTLFPLLNRWYPLVVACRGKLLLQLRCFYSQLMATSQLNASNLPLQGYKEFSYFINNLNCPFSHHKSLHSNTHTAHWAISWKNWDEWTTAYFIWKFKNSSIATGHMYMYAVKFSPSYHTLPPPLFLYSCCVHMR